MATKDLSIAKAALDSLIIKSRVHFYKPIQIAEILYRHRTKRDIDLLNLEDYRTASKKWRDDISLLLLGRTCTSSAKFQDNLFDANAIPPHILSVLGRANVRSGGGVEAYIYSHIIAKHKQLSSALKYCLETQPRDFSIKLFIDSFWNEKGLKRSLDKVYEIIVYALFSTLVEAVGFKVELSVKDEAIPILEEFGDFSKKVLCLDVSHRIHKQSATIYRLGVTNAADRGIDMYSNWGPTIQIKHLSLDVDLAQSIVNNISSNNIIIVCKDADKDVICCILNQIGWGSRVQSIVTEDDLVLWYDKALRGTYASKLSTRLLNTLAEELSLEFPIIDKMPDVIKERRYDTIPPTIWV